MKLPAITLSDGSILTDRELVTRIYETVEKKGNKNVTVRREYGYVVSTRIAPGADPDSVQSAKTARR